MSRRCRSHLAPLLPAAALAAALVLAGGGGSAYGQDSVDTNLMRPELDGDPRSPPRFRRAKEAARTADTSRFGEIQNFSHRPALGAGTTGFDSAGSTRRKRKAAPRANSATANGSAATGPSSATAKASAAPAPTVAAIVPTTPAANARPVRRQGGPPLPPPPPPDALAIAPPLGALLPRPPRPPDALPFDPLGIQVGAFVLRPALEVVRGYDTNAPRAVPPVHSWYWTVAPELLFASNWTRHELTGSFRGSYISYDSDHSLDRPNVDAKVNGRIDVTSLSRIDLEGRLVVATDRPGSPNIQADLSRLPIYTTLGGTAGIGQRFNRFDVVAKAGVDRTVYQNSHFVDGSTESNDDRNYLQYTTALRTSYDLVPGVKPFVEITADSRRHDVVPDRYGFNRNSDGVSGKAGSTFDFARSLTGEASAGYLMRSYKDPTLPRLSGFLFDASLIWTASALTTARLTARTTVDETTVPDVSGIFTREVTLQVDHAFRRWLIGTAKLSRATDIYDGSPRIDTRYLASAALVYMLNRDWQLKGEYRQEWRRSNVPGNDYAASVWLLGVRWQR